MKSVLAYLLFTDFTYEQRTALWRIAFTLILLTHIAQAYGFIPNISGFALAATMNKVESSLLEKDIIEAQERFCVSDVNGNIEAQRYAEERKRRLLAEWLELKGTKFDVPTCEELGIKHA